MTTGACRGLRWSWVLLVAGLGTARAEMVSIPPVRDNTLFEDASGSLSNGAGPVLFAGNSGQGLARRALLRFDVAAHLPPGATVVEVALTLNVSNAPNTTPRVFTLHRVLKEWGEGVSSTTSGSGAPAEAGDATWLHTDYPGLLWQGPGGDFVSTLSASQSIAGVGLYAWSDPGLVADVQSWLDQPTTDFGWLIQSDEITLNTARRFDSRENSVEANRPALAITYTTTVGVSHPTGRDPIRLAPCRPNPAVGEARFSFELPVRAHARLEVRDLAGRLIATLVDGDLEAGHHEARWGRRDEADGALPAGVYFYRLIADGRSVAARRLVVMP